jgi:hypothetical protein
MQGERFSVWFKIIIAGKLDFKTVLFFRKYEKGEIWIVKPGLQINSNSKTYII